MTQDRQAKVDAIRRALIGYLGHSEISGEYPDGTYKYEIDGTVFNVGRWANRIVHGAYGLGVFVEKPRKIEAQLEELRKRARELCHDLEALDGEVRFALDIAGDPNIRAYREACDRGDDEAADRILDRLSAGPRDQWCVMALQAGLARFEKATVPVIERAIAAAAKRPATGRKPNQTARMVALRTAEFIFESTGKLPPPRGKFENSKFEKFVSQLFEILGISQDPRHPAKWALTKLRKNS